MKFGATAAALSLFACAVVAVSALANPNLPSHGHGHAAFREWMRAHSKVYVSDAEFARRYASWLDNAKFVDAHAANPHATYTVGLNQFADLSGAEWREFVAAQGMSKSRPGRRVSVGAHTGGHGKASASSVAAPPTSADWRHLCGPVWNQQQCGSSPYFGAVDPVTVLWAQQTGLIIPLSIQQVVDCSGAEGNAGCNGGEMTDTFQYIIDNKGICSAEDYPYTGVQNNNCLASNCTNVVRITGFQNLGADETALLANVAALPVATAVDGQCSSFQLYTGGIVNDPTCAGANAQPDHGISIFGYGTDKGVDYWTLRNSWGATWGEQGYIRLIRNKNQNGLNEYLTYPTLTL